MAWDATWEDIFQNADWGKYPGEDLIRFIATNYYSKERSTVKLLEIGCGPGANVWFLAREGFDVFGIDGSETAIEKCESRLASEELSATVSVGEILDLPYPDGQFDAVIDIECLCCNDVGATKSILDEVFRVLKAGGKFYSRTFTDKLYIGDSCSADGRLEYSEVNDGPQAGKGFIRLADIDSINDIYGKNFQIECVDHSEYTLRNRSQLICEWHIICSKSS